MARKNYYQEIIYLMEDLKREHPHLNFANHVSMALSDYKNPEEISDKELLFALEKYKTELEFHIAPEVEVEKIVRDAQNLDKLFQEEEDENYD